MARPEGRKGKGFERFHTQYDFMLLFMTIAIALFGVLMIYSSSSFTGASRFDDPYRFVKQQLLGLVVGIVVMLIVSLADYQVLVVKIFGGKLNLVELFYLCALILQVLVLIPGIGQEYNGARRWLRIGPVRFQPSEITKIALILFISYLVYLSRKKMDHWLGYVRAMIFSVAAIVPIAAENMSTAIIVAGIAVGMCFVASKRWKFLGVTLVSAFAVGGLYLLTGDEFRRQRITAWLNVESDPTGYQVLQGLYAIASGGVFGSGLGESMQKLGYIPEAYNDMIFAVICEELGIVGAVLVMLAFLVLFWRIVVIACNAPDIFGTMICVGVLIHIAIQVILNIGVVTGAIPSTGVPLPFISYGGTAASIMMVEMGLVLSVSNQVKLKG